MVLCFESDVKGWVDLVSGSERVLRCVQIHVYVLHSCVCISSIPKASCGSVGGVFA